MKEFVTDRKESLYTKIYKLGLNIYPAYRRSSGRVRFISDDWKEIHVCIKLGIRNWNINMTVFGGSIYASIDPIFAIQLRNIFGKEYVIWDKEAHIVFKKPIKKKVVANFIIEDDVIAEIKDSLNSKGEYYLKLPVEFVDKVGNVHMSATKVVYIATKESYEKKIRRKKAMQK
ncbi:MAG: YiiD C-terminal domain-containing protein [Bacteroidales bacterium]|nr:YiiD C-terminal domain-containing protein [Bacteroidales bacterium]